MLQSNHPKREIAHHLQTYLDDEGGCGGDDADLGLPVLDGEHDGDLEALPVLRVEFIINNFTGITDYW